MAEPGTYASQVFDSRVQAAYLDPALYDAPLFMNREKEMHFYDQEVEKFMQTNS